MARKPFSLEFEFRNKRFQDAAAGLDYLAGKLGVSITRLPVVLRNELKDFMDYAAAEIADRHSQGWPDGTTERTLSSRSGRLQQSIRDGARVTGGSTMASVRGEFWGVHYARIHEYGGVIKAKNGKYLAIPLPAALNQVGVPLRAGPKDWDNTFVATSHAGNLIIFRKVGADVVPLYLLKTKVRIPARLGVRETIQAGVPYFVDRVMAKMVRTMMGGPHG